MKNGEVKSISSLPCICQHISRRPGHSPGTGWPGTEPDTAHSLAPEPRLGGRLLFLWLNSQAGRAGAAPSDSWSCNLTLARTERPVLPLSPSLPLLTAELGSFATFFCSLTVVTTEGCSCKAHLSWHGGEEKTVRSHSQAATPASRYQLPTTGLSPQPVKDAFRAPRFQGCTHSFPKDPSPQR